MTEIRIGCSGWSYTDWRERFYPRGVAQRKWLAFYADRFDTVELDNSFYRLVKESAASRWASETPPGFIFSAKMSRYVTHTRRLADVESGAARFYEGFTPLLDAGKLGPIEWQLPANFHRDDDRLASALEQIDALPGRHAFEFRDPSWFVPEVEALLRRHDVALIVGDDPSRPFQTETRTADFMLVRFHRGRRGRRGNYSETELRSWAARIRAWSRDGDVYAYFNDDWEAFAPRNAARLKQLVAAAA